MPCLEEEEEEEEELAPEEKSSSNFPLSLSFPPAYFSAWERKRPKVTLFSRGKKGKARGAHCTLQYKKLFLRQKIESFFCTKELCISLFESHTFAKVAFFSFWDRSGERCSQAIIMSHYSRYLACALPGHYKRIAHLPPPLLLLLFGS